MKQLLQFEWYYHLKQRAFFGLSILFLGFGFQLGHQAFAPAQVHINAPYQIIYNVGLMSLGVVFIVMFFSIKGIIRDKTFQTEELMFSTPITKKKIFFSRFLGVFLSSLFVFSTVLIGFAFGAHTANVEGERIAVFEMLPYLITWLLIIVPNVFICSVIVFSIAALTKRDIATYIGAILVYVMYMIASIFFNSPLLANVTASSQAMSWTTILDPFGLASFFKETQFWTPVQKNEELIPLWSSFLLNRLTWIVLGIVILILTFLKFKMVTISNRKKKYKKIKTSKRKHSLYKSVETSPQASITIMKQLSYLLRLELFQVFKSKPYIAICGLWILLLLIELKTLVFNSGTHGEVIQPTTFLIIEAIKQPLLIFCLLLLGFYSGEIIWKEKNIRIDELLNVSPTTNSVFFIAKSIVIIMLPISLIMFSWAISILFQLILGYQEISFIVYATELVYLSARFLLLGVFMIFIQNMVKNKYIGIGLSVGIVMFLSSFLAGKIGIYHPVFKIGFLPKLMYSEFQIDFGNQAMYWYLGYWLLLTFVLIILSFKVWQRSKHSQLKEKLTLLFSIRNSKQILVLIVFLVGVISVGTYIYKSHEIVIPELENDWSEAYERQYKKYEKYGVLFPKSIKTTVDLFPSKNAFNFKANYMMMNTGNEIVDTLLITERLPLKRIDSPKGELIKHDEELGVFLFKLHKPLQFNDSISFSIELNYQARKFDSNVLVVSDGTYLRHKDFEPFFGYRKVLEIANVSERKNRELAIDTISKPSNKPQAQKINFETVISTESDQIAISIGEFKREWKDDGRHFYAYKTQTKVLPNLAYISGQFIEKRAMHNNIKLSQFFNKKHYKNIDVIETIAKKTIDYCSENFGNYSFDHLRIVEVPAAWSFNGFAHSGTILMNEKKLYLYDNEQSDMNVTAKRTAHEVSHQWFGHYLMPEMVRGSSLLIEGLAQYVEAVIMEQYEGASTISKLTNAAGNRYFRGRAFALTNEPTLENVNNTDAYLYYGKSQVVFLALRDLIGEQQLNVIIREFLKQHAQGNSFSGRSSEFINLLLDSTSEKYHKKINELFRNRIRYDLSIVNQSYHKNKDETYSISLKVRAKQFSTDDFGKEMEESLNETIEIATYINSQINYSKKFQLTSGINTITIISSQLPEEVIVDPYSLYLDKNLQDNSVVLK